MSGTNSIKQLKEKIHDQLEPYRSTIRPTDHSNHGRTSLTTAKRAIAKTLMDHLNKLGDNTTKEALTTTLALACIANDRAVHADRTMSTKDMIARYLRKDERRLGFLWWRVHEHYDGKLGDIILACQEMVAGFNPQPQEATTAPAISEPSETDSKESEEGAADGTGTAAGEVEVTPAPTQPLEDVGITDDALSELVNAHNLGPALKEALQKAVPSATTDPGESAGAAGGGVPTSTDVMQEAAAAPGADAHQSTDAGAAPAPGEQPQ